MYPIKTAMGYLTPQQLNSTTQNEKKPVVVKEEPKLEPKTDGYAGRAYTPPPGSNGVFGNYVGSHA
jgi:hypothetical protein